MVAQLSASKEDLTWNEKSCPNQKRRTDLSFTLVVAMMLIGFDDSKESNSNEDHNSPLLSVLSIKDKRIMKSFAKLRGTPYFFVSSSSSPS